MKVYRYFSWDLYTSHPNEGQPVFFLRLSHFTPERHFLKTVYNVLLRERNLLSRNILFNFVRSLKSLLNGKSQIRRDQIWIGEILRNLKDAIF